MDATEVRAADTARWTTRSWVLAVLAAVLLVLVLIFLGLVAIGAWDLITVQQQVAFGLLATALGLIALGLVLVAAKPFRVGFWKWVRSRPGSLPFLAWVVVAMPLFIGALVARDSSVRLAFAIAFGVASIVMGITALLAWALIQRVKTEDIVTLAGAAPELARSLTGAPEPSATDRTNESSGTDVDTRTEATPKVKPEPEAASDQTEVTDKPVAQPSGIAKSPPD
jgi:hypothetical protein